MPELEQQVLVEAEATRPILDQIADKWSVMILEVIYTQPARFNAIKRRLGRITHKALTQALRRLERPRNAARDRHLANRDRVLDHARWAILLQHPL